MPIDGRTIITTRGDQRLTQAMISSTAVGISHISMGDGNGAKYNPGAGQTALKNEIVRMPIERQHVVGDSAWRVKTVFPAADLSGFWVREIGFFDTEGDLIFLWAGTDIEDRYAGAVDYLADHTLVLSGIDDGLIYVNAPYDEYFDNAVIKLKGDAQSALRHHNLSIRMRALSARS